MMTLVIAIGPQRARRASRLLACRPYLTSPLTSPFASGPPHGVLANAEVFSPSGFVSSMLSPLPPTIRQARPTSELVCRDDECTVRPRGSGRKQPADTDHWPSARS